MLLATLLSLLAANINKTITINPSATLKDKSAKYLTKHHIQKTHKILNVPSKLVWEHYISDVLTKPLSRVRFEYFQDKLGVVRKDLPRKGE
jgi:hypothetical protein